MKVRATAFICSVLTAAVIGMPDAWAARSRRGAPPPSGIELLETGTQLEAEYGEQLTTLKAEIQAALPRIDGQKRAAYEKTFEAVKAAQAGLNEAQKGVDQIGKAAWSLTCARKWMVPRERKNVELSREKLKKAATDAERSAAREELTKYEDKLKSSTRALAERQEQYDKLLREEPVLKRKLEAAKESLAAAKARTVKALESLGLETFFASDALDARLAKYVVLSEATPRGLAAFAQQGEAQQKLVGALLADAPLMIQIAVADGAKKGKYGQAMEIYSRIQKASSRPKDGILQRLALAIGLEHAVPMSQSNPKTRTDAPATVDPVKRYLQFEKAYLGGELDSRFKGLSTWDLRMVVNGDEPDETSVWGRQMLRNYRPDHITMADYAWRYVAAVKTEVKYGSADGKYDKPEQQAYQNILMNGGICGRRAFFGRFILRAFGIPTTARPSRGHGALAHWTPDGWVVCLGGGWGKGWTTTRGHRENDLDFLANTQARENRKAYLQVERAQWIGDVVGEKPVYGLLARGEPGFWYGISLYRQSKIIADVSAAALAPVGEDIAEANESKVEEEVEAVTITDEDRKIVVDRSGVITIPAAACSNPTKSTSKIIFMPSNLGGLQLHYSRTGKDMDFEYTFDAPKTGRYALVARVVTPSWKQHLFVSANGVTTPVDIPLPYTVGMWDKTEPVEIRLVRGRNVLKFSRRHEGLKGVTIRDFTLTALN